ncbi:uncharacterized protein LOC119453375 isoform X2 [Dermacentor silvarum]|uniref:uncharacterized protein LOC119445577 isoform X2 n=1 Tax=Dermacentor silvarum TaxID=543639 RepID=UPI00189BA3E7|nr:uncharacterized protein LOC119445577 isoform X2 [Dermacentor silvarum]XP_037571344.1 uncharacterized protein LOC119453375 isoform X2 [Dermacentor silvarum]
MAGTRWLLLLYFITGVVLPEVQLFSTSPLLCQRLISFIPRFHARQCTFPCRLLSDDVHFLGRSPIIFQTEQDWTPCTVGHCISGICMPLQAHPAQKRRKRSVLLTMAAIRAGKRLITKLANRGP